MAGFGTRRRHMERKKMNRVKTVTEFEAPVIDRRAERRIKERGVDISRRSNWSSR